MPFHCPKCKYDLTGLVGDAAVCPECGTKADPAAVAAEHYRISRRRWRYFLLAPILALPGIVAFGVGQPIVTFGLAVIFGYRAMNHDDLMTIRPRSSGMRFTEAVVMGAVWTCVSEFMLLVAILTIVAFVGMFIPI